jgi:hypothetical protein
MQQIIQQIRFQDKKKTVGITFGAVTDILYQNSITSHIGMWSHHPHLYVFGTQNAQTRSKFLSGFF